MSQLQQVDYLSPHLRKQYQDKVKNIENTLNNIKHSEYHAERNLPVGQLLKQKRETEKLLAERTAPAIDGQERDRLSARAKELEKKIKDGMPTKDEMMGERISIDGNPNKKGQRARPDVVKRNTDWMIRTAGWIREWKNIMKTLEPDDSHACNVERLRKGGMT